ncbi:MAG TPA: hypothetical protein VGJ45_32880 [Pseudonocardiaceae bacterium]|jgi:hypothetical protein
MASGDFDDFPEDADRESLQELADRFFAGEPSGEEPAPPVRRPIARFAGAATALALLVAVPVLLTQQPAVSSQPASTRTIELALDPPVDQGPAVELTWRGPPDLQYAIVVAGLAQSAQVIFVSPHRTDLLVPLDPARQYCFQLQATDGANVYQTAPRGIRGATCRQ